MPKVVLVTGASSGIGRAIAEHLARRGDIVFGTSRRANAEAPPGVTMLPLDVTSDESVSACVGAVLAQAGRLDALVNNAGVALTGGVEEVSIDEARRLFETNFFGVARMTRAVLPHMRDARRGHVITIGSASGLAGVPFAGYYSASKHALEGLSEALRHEMRPFGVQVAMVEPGYFRSAISEVGNTAAERIPAYERWREAAERALQHGVVNGADPALVAQLVAHILDSSNPSLRNPVGVEGVLAAFGRRFALPAVYEQGTRYFMGMDDWREDARRYAPLAGALLVGLVALLGLRRRND
jgi:NAD(P)-dependent dehydrogenase (short-subunit alcohol dehydrogenase family)